MDISGEVMSPDRFRLRRQTGPREDFWMSRRLHSMCGRKGLVLARVAEVGVYYPETSNILEFIQEGIPAVLVEADPVCLTRIRSYFNSFGNVRVFPYAIWDESGRISLYRANSSTFASDLTDSPAMVNDDYVPDERDRFEVEARRFSEIDEGDIDLISIDIEGGEWYVLKHMRSRPLVIALETHAAEYRNPFLPQIEQWMRDNGYWRWFMDNTDTVYVRDGAAEFSAGERLWRRLANAAAVTRHRLKGMKRVVRNKMLGRRHP